MQNIIEKSKKHSTSIKKKYSHLLLLMAIFVSALIAYTFYAYRYQVWRDPFRGVVFKVVEVVDGDTMRLVATNTAIIVRALGIDTPETVHPDKPVECFGKEASDKAKELLHNQYVYLRFSPNREVKDRYRRYLAYIYRVDGLFFNIYMLKNGYAREYTVGKPYSLQNDFRLAQKTSRDNRVGVWGCE